MGPIVLSRCPQLAAVVAAVHAASPVAYKQNIRNARNIWGCARGFRPPDIGLAPIVGYGPAAPLLGPAARVIVLPIRPDQLPIGCIARCTTLVADRLGRARMGR
jgi:hypothetical protein